jgi:hypothetical protein
MFMQVFRDVYVHMDEVISETKMRIATEMCSWNCNFIYRSLSLGWHVHIPRFSSHSVCRDARWYIFKPKIPIGVNFGRSWNGRCWFMLWPFGMFYGHLVYFMAIWYMYLISGNLEYFPPFWYIVPRKLWQPRVSAPLFHRSPYLCHSTKIGECSATDWTSCLISVLKHSWASLEQSCRICLVHDTRDQKNVPNEHKMYQIVINYPKCP